MKSFSFLSVLTAAAFCLVFFVQETFAENAPVDSGTAGESGEFSVPIPAPAVLDVVSPVSFLGMQLLDAYKTLGVPDTVFSMRGEEAWQDDVVFFYREPRVYLFWFRDRVWQLRFDEKSQSIPLGLYMGMSERELPAALGKPVAEEAGSRIFSIPSPSYPIRVRLFFTNGALSDLYIYRGDF